MFEINDEQLKIINEIKLGNNLIIEAVAGSGKTSTCLLLGNEFKDKNIILVTYNKRLSQETEERISKMNLKNIDAKTIHSFIGKAYGKIARDDTSIDDILENETPIKFKDYDLMIIDEAQDLLDIYFEAIYKWMLFTEFKGQIIVMGDSRQNIYKFKGTDSRYLLNAGFNFDVNGREWVRCYLTKSFRVTKEVCDFLNNVYFNFKFIQSYKAINDSFKYLTIDSFETERLYYSLENCFKKYSDEEIFIIAPKVAGLKDGHPLAKFINYLSEIQERKIYIADSNIENISDKDLMNKLIVTTIQQTKGRERKVAIVFNCDEDYFKFYGRNEDRKYPLNNFYVALTRGTESTVLINHSNAKAMPFYNQKKLLEYTYLETGDLTNVDELEISDNVTHFIKFIPSFVIKYFISKLKITKEVYSDDMPRPNFINRIQTLTGERELFENVSPINGLAIPLFYFSKNQIEKMIDSLNKNIAVYNENSNLGMFKKYIEKAFESDNFLYKVAAITSVQEQNIIYLSQIKYDLYNWFSEKDFNLFNNIFDKYLSKNIESEILIDISREDLKLKLIGIIDAIDFKNKIVWEFKYVNKVSDDHFLQLLMYKWLIKNSDEIDFEEKNVTKEEVLNYDYKVLNIETGEIWKLEIQDEDLENVIKAILKFKRNYLNESDSEFTNKINSIKEKYIDLVNKQEN